MYYNVVMYSFVLSFFFFFFNDTATTEIYTLSLHDALPIWPARHTDNPLKRMLSIKRACMQDSLAAALVTQRGRSEEHTSELQSPCNLVCRLLLEKKKNKMTYYIYICLTTRRH